MLSNILDKISFWLIFIIIVLLPIFFLPFTQIPIEISKGLLIVVGLVLSIIFWIIARLFDGKIILPKSWFLFSGLGVLLSFFLSSIFSSSINASFFGIMFDIGTFYFMLGAFLLMLFSSIIFRDIKNAKIVLWGMIISSIILFLFQTLYLFLPNLLSFGILSEKTDNILGSWNAFGLFVGFSIIISLFVVEFFSISKKIKWLLKFFIAFLIVLSITINFLLIWEIVGIFALIIFIYKIYFTFSKVNEEENKKRYFPTFSFIIIMISLLFFMSSKFIVGFLPNTLNLSNVEVKPSFESTISITTLALKENPILGVGPNNFGQVWAMYKPQIINLTQFWDTSFNVGFGLLPTFASTTGFLGILSWFVFFILFIITGIKSLLLSIKNNINLEIVLFFIASLYLFISSFFYSPGEVIFLLAFIFAGIFIGLSSSSHQNKEISFSFLNDYRKSFFSILFLVILMIVSLAFSFKYIEKFISVFYFKKTFSASSLSMAEDYIAKAISLHQNDLYLRTSTQVYLTKINSIITKGSDISDTDKADLQTSFDKALNSAQLAVFYDSKNYLNYNSLGNVYNTAGLLGIKDYYSKAIEAYKMASALNPLNPGIKLNIANVYFNDGKITEAKNLAKEVLSLKPDYIEALIFISKIEKGDGNNASAISYAENALSLDPNNKDLIQYVDSLKNNSSISASGIEENVINKEKIQ